MRVTVIALLLAANGLLWSWGQGHFATLGWPSPKHNHPVADADPNAVIAALPHADTPASAESSTLETTISTSIAEQSSTKRTPYVTDRKSVV